MDFLALARVGSLQPRQNVLLGWIYGTVKLRTVMCLTLVTRVEGGVEGVGTAGVVSSNGVSESDWANDDRGDKLS